jgi:hypothetical protein
MPRPPAFVSPSSVGAGFKPALFLFQTILTAINAINTYNNPFQAALSPP